MLDLRKFYQSTNPGYTLTPNSAEDRQFYIDFSSVRGGEIIDKLKNKITFLSSEKPTCTLFTGHIGCGKSTELRRLQARLEQDGFHVVYFESSDDLELTDVDVADILLAIARRISQSLEKLKLAEPQRFKELLQGAARVLNAEVQGIKFKPLGKDAGEVGVTAKDGTFSLSFGIGEITAKTKSDATLRERLNQYLAPQTATLLDLVNRELLEPAIAALKAQGKQGLVAIVDNLDRIDSRPKPFGQPQTEYLFVDRAEYLTKLHCHLIYTMPLALKFSNAYGMLTQWWEHPKVLPMVPVQDRKGHEHVEGMALLRRMVLARAFPELSPEFDEAKCQAAIPQIFDSPNSLDRLCRISGGHVRDLLRLVNTWIQEEMALPLSRRTLEAVIRQYRNEMAMPISDEEWELLRQVQQKKKVSDDLGYQKLIRSRFVFEYRDNGESWFEVNPILEEEMGRVDS
jgi:AAA ATPase domain